VVPETEIQLPTRTAREYPTIGSHFVPVATFFLSITHCSRLISLSL
jgi:hypothetical protein